MKLNIIPRQRPGILIVILVSAVAMIAFLLVSNNLIKQLATQERERMDIWAQATQRLAQADVDSDFEFLLGIIAQNNSIPVLITDKDFNIYEFRNFDLPDKGDMDKSLYSELSDRNKEYLLKKLKKPGGDTPLDVMAARNDHFIAIEMAEGSDQYIYYEDSKLLRSLTAYPYIQMGVMIILALILYMAVVYTKRAEQNRVWVGLSKETAHQLGTPISSLMAWLQLLEAEGVDKETVREMDKDVNRLSTIASRFSKIGSRPSMEPMEINGVVSQAVNYMKSRISRRISLTFTSSSSSVEANLSAPLLEWVMENLIKNAVDAMDGQGAITVKVKSTYDKAVITVSDTGKGMTRKQRSDIFKPGYSTKKRGWGLGLTLARRIITQYHGGRIYVSDSQPGIGTTFTIELPLTSTPATPDA